MRNGTRRADADGNWLLFPAQFYDLCKGGGRAAAAHYVSPHRLIIRINLRVLVPGLVNLVILIS